jgi:hypothetical protein
MTNFTDLPCVASKRLVPLTDQPRLAVAAYLARFKGSSRDHTESDLRFYPRRPHLELYIRWMQEIRRFKPSTVSRRFSVTAGFYRPASSMACWSTHPTSTSAGPPSRQTAWLRMTPQRLFSFAELAWQGVSASS